MGQPLWCGKGSEFKMKRKTAVMEPRKRIALVAHDHKKDDLLEWALFIREILTQH